MNRPRQQAPALLSIIAPALFTLRPSMGSYLLNLTSREEGNVIFCMEQNRPFSRVRSRMQGGVGLEARYLWLPDCGALTVILVFPLKE